MFSPNDGPTAACDARPDPSGPPPFACAAIAPAYDCTNDCRCDHAPPALHAGPADDTPRRTTRRTPPASDTRLQQLATIANDAARREPPQWIGFVTLMV